MARSLILVGLLTLMVPVVASASLITVDGDLSDWGSGSGWGSWTDGDDAAVGQTYDIYKVYWHFGEKWGDPAESTLFLGVEFYDAFPPSGTGSRGLNDFFNIQFDTVAGSGGSPTGMGGNWSTSDYYFRWNLPDTPYTGPATGTDLVLFRWTGAAWGWYSGGAKEVGDNGVWSGWSNDTTNGLWAAEFAMPVSQLWGAGLPDDFAFSVYYDNGLPSADDFAPGEETFVPVDIPEPGTMALFGLGMFGLLALRRRRAA